MEGCISIPSFFGVCPLLEKEANQIFEPAIRRDEKCGTKFAVMIDIRSFF